MNEDKEIEELFRTSTPQFDDSRDFMARLGKRLEAVEYIKKHQEATLRRYKMAVVAAFVVGIISGGVTIGVVNGMTLDTTALDIQVQALTLSVNLDSVRPIVTGGLSLLMTMGLICIVRNVMEIVAMRAGEKREL